MREVVLVAEVGRKRGTGPARAVRRAGNVPAVVYGLGGDPVSVAVNDHDLAKILHGPGGANTLINLDMNGDKELVLCRQVQRHPVRHHLVHVDLIRVRRDQAVSAEVAVHLVGDAEGVRDGGLVEQSVFALSIEAKPADLPAAIEVDVTALGIGDQILVAGLELPPGVITTQNPDDLVVHVVQPRGLTAAEEEEEGPEGEGAEGEDAGGEAPGE